MKVPALIPPVLFLSRVHRPGIRAIEVSEHARCRIDGVMLARHERCQECGVLMGPGHVEAHSASGYCSVCARDVAMTVRRQAAGAC